MKVLLKSGSREQCTGSTGISQKCWNALQKKKKKRLKRKRNKFSTLSKQSHSASMKELTRCSKILAPEKLNIPFLTILSPTLGINSGNHGTTPPCKLTL